MLFLKIVLIVSFPPHDSGADSPTCSNGVTPPNKNKSHNKYTGISSASSSPSSSPSSVNYSESNSTDSTKSQPHSATSNQETRCVVVFFGLVTLRQTEKQNMHTLYASKAKHINLLCTYILERPAAAAADCVFLCVDSDSEMEIEAEHYSNGVTESSTRIMNGTYKHQEILQADDSSVGNGVAGTTRMQDFQNHIH